MSKESEALSRLYYTVRVLQSEINQKEQLLGSNTTFDVLEQTDKDVKILKEALLRLEAIDNANPSEALELFKEFKGILLENIVLVDTDLQKFNIIKQALLKAQEQEKENKLLKEIIKGMEI